MSRKLAALGVARVGVVATAAERSRLYFLFRPTPIPFGADPELSRHRAYGLPNLPETPAVLAAVGRAARQRTRELGVEAMPGEATHRALAGSRKGRYHRRRLDQE